MNQDSNADIELTLRALAGNLRQAEQFQHLNDLLFLPPRSNAQVLHEYTSGLFHWFGCAATTCALLALRRCIDGSGKSLGLRASAQTLVKNGRLKDEPLRIAPDLENRVRVMTS